MEAAGGDCVVSSYEDNSLSGIADLNVLDIPQDELNWSSIRLADIINRDTRLEASVYGIEGRHARETINNSKWAIKTLCGDNGLSTAYYPSRFKGVWVDKSTLPIYQPSQITEIYPKPNSYISEATKTDVNVLRVKKGQILLTRSGTIGKCSIVTDTLYNKIFSDDLIRITCLEEADVGYVYAFLKSKTGNTLINTNNYGAVISHIEPKHLSDIPIPDPPKMLKYRIHELIMKSFRLRDESNILLDRAEALLIKELKLPPVNEFQLNNLDPSVEVNNFVVKFSELNKRLEASFHAPIVKAISSHLKDHALEITSVGNAQISKNIILPGRFKRVYVSEGQGVLFFGGKQLLELSPTETKYLSTKQHTSRIDRELRLKENMVLLTRSGTIGKTALVPKHWENWIANEHIIRILPASNSIAGYLYVFLSTEYGKELIKRFTYGSVVDEIDDRHVSQIQVPLMQSSCMKQINDLALKANELRYEAYALEQQALSVFNHEVLKTELGIT